MRGILADNDVEGVLDILTRIWLSDAWRDLWDELGCALETFDSLGLSRDAPDSLVWSTCQRREVVLITGNRNAESPESLEATIRRSNQPNSLPVFTLANPRRVLRDRGYSELVAERLLDYLIQAEECRGTGRIYVP